MEDVQRPTAEDTRPSLAAGGAHSTSARSCITCAKAKAKCVRQPGQQVCDRCTRLHKDCQLKIPVQRRRKPAKLTRTAQLENLENKLHNLVHALSAQQAQQSQIQPQQRQQPPQPVENVHPSPSTSHDASEKEASIADHYNPTTCDHTFSDKHTNTNSCTAPSAPTSTTGITPVSSYQSLQPSSMENNTISMDDATILLDRYRRLMAPTMPFVVIPDIIDAWELAHTKPFLMQVIATVAYFPDLPKQQFMVKDLMRQISEKLIMRNEKSLETLQGILILVSWYHPHIIWAQQSVLLLHLAMSLTADLNIDRSPDSCEKFRLAHKGKGGIPAPPPFSNEERRAFLGTFYLTSMMSTSFKKLSALKWSPWMVDCACVLEKEVEYESDPFLVSMVRMQHLMEDVMNIETFDAPVRFLANSYQADLDSIPLPHVTGKPKTLLQQQRAMAHMAIWTHALTGLGENKPKQQSSELHQRLDAMWRCVESARSYFELYLAIPPQDFLLLPFQVFGQSVQASVTLLRLATLEVEGWDLAALREELSYSSVIGEITRVFESVETLPVDGIPIRNDAFTKWAAKTRWMKSLYDNRYPPYSDGSSNNDNNVPFPTPDLNCNEGGRRWPDVPQQQQQPQSFPGAPAVTDNGDLAQHQQQQPTPSEEWTASMTNPQNVFTYFDDAFWNSFNFENMDFGAALPGDVQMN